MLDTMTLTKVVGGFCGALLIYLLGVWMGDLLYHGTSGHHGDEHKQAYVVEIEGGDNAAAEEADAIDMAALVAEADVAKGAKVFGKCKACHKIEAGANSTGPTLFGVVNRDIASEPGFAYSGALEGIEGNWDYDHLASFLENPKGYAPGTKMAFAGLKKPKDRANVIAYLESIK